MHEKRPHKSPPSDTHRVSALGRLALTRMKFWATRPPQTINTHFVRHMFAIFINIEVTQGVLLFIDENKCIKV